ncbi:LysR substrate-binding domain-containing protein [Pseudarthrobacter sp. B4EP4b]|uniref:LysR substrate-binding domain-containing protein n=1 Tax=Pseudarthrobacter sp. B4EP4b TaxID=2590664 RepID=UPI001153A4A8|nr:LysR substrate-binding domain-containing protein [Pseudarthrobacter sp. B4EP4b]
MEIRHLRYFLVLAEELHFNRAAERLHIAQPALSQQVRQLEKELDVELFIRTTRKVELTLAGASLKKHALEILSNVESVKDLVARVATGETGRLTLGFTGSATYDLLPRIARAVTEKMSGVSLVLRGEMATASQIEALRSNAIDIGFLRPPISGEFHQRVVRTDYLSLLMPASHPLAGEESIDLAQMADESFIQYSASADPATFTIVSSAYQQAGFEAIVHQEVDATSVMVSLVAAGLGMALVPNSVSHVRVDGAVIRPLSSPIIPMNLVAAWKVENDLPAISRFIQILDLEFPR